MFSLGSIRFMVAPNDPGPDGRDPVAGSAPAAAGRTMSGTSAAIVRTTVTVLALCLAAPCAHADEDEDTRTMAVSTRGMNLATLAGQAELGRRIEGAARRVCDSDGAVLLAARRAYDRCHDEAMAGARRQMQVLIARASTPGAAGAVEVAEARP